MPSVLPLVGRHFGEPQGVRSARVGRLVALGNAALNQWLVAVLEPGRGPAPLA